jgi:hypothetical protein
VAFSLKLTPGVQIQASRYGLQTNRGPNAPDVYIRRQFADFAIPGAPLTFYTQQNASGATVISGATATADR